MVKHAATQGSLQGRCKQPRAVFSRRLRLVCGLFPYPECRVSRDACQEQSDKFRDVATAAERMKALRRRRGIHARLDVVHGTQAGYRKHLRRTGNWSVPACDACQAAHAEALRQWRRR